MVKLKTVNDISKNVCFLNNTPMVNYIYIYISISIMKSDTLMPIYIPTAKSPYTIHTPIVKYIICTTKFE